MNRAVRIIDNAKTASHSDPIFFKYKILKLNDLTDFNQATSMYKYTKNLLPSSFNDTFKTLGNFERDLNYRIDILNTASLGIFKKSLLEMLSDAYIPKCNKPSCYSCKILVDYCTCLILFCFTY